MADSDSSVTTEEKKARQKTYHDKWYTKNRDEINARASARRAANPDKEKAYQAKYRASGKGTANAAKHRASAKAKATQAKWVAANQEKVKAAQAKYRASPGRKAWETKYRAANRDKQNANAAKYRAANLEKCRAAGVKHEATKRFRYGIFASEKYALLKAQDGVCKICGGNEWGKKGPNIDHSHDRGHVRGILCGHCNRGIGYFRDDIALLMAAIQYLEDDIRKHPITERP
jgi:hypothetical protein